MKDTHLTIEQKAGSNLEDKVFILYMSIVKAKFRIIITYDPRTLIS